MTFHSYKQLIFDGKYQKYINENYLRFFARPVINSFGHWM